MLKWTVLTITIITLLLAGACSFIQTAQEFTQAGDSFLTALKEERYGEAYGICAPGLQEEIGAIEDLQNGIQGNSAQPESWSFSSWSTAKDENQQDTAKLEGSITYQDGKSGGVTLELVKLDADWKVISFNLTW